MSNPVGDPLTPSLKLDALAVAGCALPPPSRALMTEIAEALEVGLKVFCEGAGISFEDGPDTPEDADSVRLEAARIAYAVIAARAGARPRVITGT